MQSTSAPCHANSLAIASRGLVRVGRPDMEWRSHHFAEDKAVVIKGPVMHAYKGVLGIEADHVTLILRGVMPRLEVRLLRYRHPAAGRSHIEKVGSNHVCFAVDDIEAEVAQLRALTGRPHTRTGGPAKREASDRASRSHLHRTIRRPIAEAIPRRRRS